MTSPLRVNTAPRQAAPYRRPRWRATRALAALCLGVTALASEASPALAAKITHTAKYTFYGDSAADEFGESVSGAGDVNGDGFDDLIVGAPIGNYARVLSGADGSELYTFNGDSAGDRFGLSVSGTGDVDGDGFDDLIVGAWVDDNNGNNSGSARVLSGADGSELYTFNGDSAGDRFGYSVSGAGDVDGDGRADLIVGAYRDDPNGGDSGSARVLSGVDGTTLYTFAGDSRNDAFGWSVSGAGDVNGDGFDDLIVGAPSDDADGGNFGSARVLSGADGTILFTVYGDNRKDYFGASVSGAGDVNNDGIADFIVGAARYSDGGGNGGGYARVFVSNGAGLEEGGAVPVPGALALLGAGLAALRYLRRR